MNLNLFLMVAVIALLLFVLLKYIDLSRSVGVLNIDTSDPDKDKYQFVITGISLEDLGKRKKITLRINHLGGTKHG